MIKADAVPTTSGLNGIQGGGQHRRPGVSPHNPAARQLVKLGSSVCRAAATAASTAWGLNRRAVSTAMVRAFTRSAWGLIAVVGLYRRHSRMY